MNSDPANAPTEPPPQDDPRTVVLPSLDGGAALPPGHALQEYVVEGVVGEGGFGIVYLARDTRLGRLVALKEYMPATLATRGKHQSVSVRSERHRETFELGLRSFVNEAQLLASFDHPSLVKVYRFWEANGTAYMVMPYYQGPTLKKWLRDLGQPPEEQWLMALLAPMIDALEQLHNDRCYHRDIAPDNILLLPLQGTQAGAGASAVRPLLLDFGAARRVIGDMTQALTVILKPGYAPIEQYADSVAMKQGPWTDVYALSAVLYACVNGRAPLPSVSRVISDDMVPASRAGAGRYSPMFLAAIDAGLALRPEARPQSMAALRALFAAASRGEAGLVLPANTAAVSRLAPILAPLSAPKTPLSARIEPVMSDGSHASDVTLIAAPEPGAPASPWPLRLSLAAAALVAGAAGWWFSTRSPADERLASAPIAEPPASAAVQVPVNTAAAPPVLTSAPPNVAPPPEFSVAAALQDIVDRSDPQLTVTAKADKSTLVIGKDLLKFRVKASESGYLYIFLGGTDKRHFHLLFPSQFDKNNRIEGDREVVLPRKGWDITAGGPPGTNHIVALVSRQERSLTDVGLSVTAGAFPEFDLAAAQQRWVSRQADPRGISPFLGKAVCSAAPCDEAYGATLIEVREVASSAKTRH